MNWEAIGAVGEILGALAVVATLGYLATQIRFAHRAASDVNRQNRGIAVREMLLAMATNEDLRTPWIKAEARESRNTSIRSLLGLDADEADRVVWSCQYWFWVHWAQWASTKTEEDVEELKHLIAAWYTRPPMSVVWRESEDVQILDEDFVAFVNDALSAQNPGDPAT